MHGERISEIIRIGFTVVGLLILATFVIYLAIRFQVWFIQRAATQAN